MRLRYDSMPIAMREIVSQYGTGVVKELRFLNILSDVFQFTDCQSISNIIRHIYKNGYGEKIADCLGTIQWPIKLNAIKQELSLRSGFDVALTEFILRSFAFGLSLTETLPQNPIKQLTSEIAHRDLDKELEELKALYLKQLDDCITVPEDESGYYTTHDKTILFVTESKIHILSKALNKDDANWCNAKKQDMLNKYYVEKQVQSSFWSRLFNKKR